MKICHLTITNQCHLPRLYKECKSAKQVGYKPYIVSGGDTFVDAGIQYIGVPFRYSSRRKMFRLAKEVVNKGLEIDADIYQLHDPIFLLFALKLKRRGKKVIFDSHEFYGLQIREKQYLPKILRNSIAYIYMCLEAYICKRIDAVIQVCTLEGLDYFKKRCRKTIFLINASESLFFVPNNIIPFERRNKVVHVGALTYNRGITHLVEAGLYTNVKIELVGSFSSKTYEEQVQQISGYENVIYRGYVDKKELPSILNESFAGISTLLNVGQYSKIDTLPTKVYEYMAMGLPVILSNTPYNVTLNRKYDFAICVDPADSKNIAQAINYLKDNPSIAKEMGERGRQLVLNYFNWEIEGKKLLELYSQL